MGFWGRVKDVLVSGPTTAVKNERAEDAVENAPPAGAPREKVKQPKVDVPPQSAPQPPQQQAPAPEAEPVGEPEYPTYTVKSGDTLSEIAASYGVDWREMARLNNLENPDLIFPGQVFKVPNS